LTIEEIKTKNLVLCTYIDSLNTNYHVVAEYDTNFNNDNVIVVQEVNGEKETFYGDLNPLFNYYQIDVFGLKIESTKNVSVVLGNLIGTSTLLTYNNETWQIIFMQMTNPQPIEYSDLRRVSYNMTLKCIVNKI
jgi:hypothetical protein